MGVADPQGTPARSRGQENAPYTVATTFIFAALVVAVVPARPIVRVDLSANAPADSTLTRPWPGRCWSGQHLRQTYSGAVRWDVAIYIMPYKLDAFNDLREITPSVQGGKGGLLTARLPKVIMVGHSLGSVSRMTRSTCLSSRMNRPEAVMRGSSFTSVRGVLDVVAALRSFSLRSPLDRPPHFRGAGTRTSEAREALAGSVQPLIQDYARRPARWINFLSPLDIISGRLDLYDLPPDLHDFASYSGSESAQRERPEATTLLMRTPSTGRIRAGATIYNEIGAINPSAPRR